MKALITSACLALAALCFAAPASAGARDENRIVVRYGDLDLGNPADAYRMYGRLANAAVEACGGRPNGYAPLETRRRRIAFEACVEGSLGRAVARLREPMVTAYHRDHPLIIASR